VISATMVEERQSEDGYQAVFVGRFEAGLPTIFAGPYDVSEIERRNTRLRTYFHAGSEGLSELYLEQSADYIDDYAREIGAYPHPDFAMISAPVELGLGFPGIAYLNRDILALPFTRTRALAHEVLHNWWGNGVHPDFNTGNWAEGLTTYMADYRLAERAGPQAVRDMRREWLHDLNALPDAYDVPVRAFVGQGHGAAQAIGYSKVAMIFHR
jgi:aminopeptidase N